MTRAPKPARKNSAMAKLQNAHGHRGQPNQAAKDEADRVQEAQGLGQAELDGELGRAHDYDEDACVEEGHDFCGMQGGWAVLPVCPALGMLVVVLL